MINIRTCREYWHEGAGKDEPDKNFWNRYQIIKNFFLKNNEYNFVKNCENKNKDWSKKLWEARLQKL